MFKFEKLKVWQKSRLFCKEIYKITRVFIPEERFGLTSQVRRAAMSVSLNIAEGSTARTDKDFNYFLTRSTGSINEVITGLYIALDQQYIRKTNFDEIYSNAEELAKMISCLQKKLC